MTRRSLALAATLFFVPVMNGGFASAQADPSISDEIAIVRVVDAIDRAVDDQDWSRARSYFTDGVHVDFSSLSGQPAANITADQLIGAWSSNLKGGKTSFHMRTNHQIEIEGDRAEVVSAGYAWNRLEGNGDPLWEVWGVYGHTLTRTPQGWKVNAMSLRVTNERGNQWVKATPGE